MLTNIYSTRNNYLKYSKKYNEINILNLNNLKSFNSNDIISKIYDQRIGKTNKFSDLVFVEQQIPKKISNIFFISSPPSTVFPDGIKISYFNEVFPEFFMKLNDFLPPAISIDWKNIILYFISFLCLAFSFNAFSDEKQNGTLKLMLTNNISRSKIFVAKYLSLIIILVTPFLIGIIISLICFNILGYQLYINDYLNILIFMIVTLIFVSFNILLGFLISILSSKSDTSLNICLILWIIFLLVIPNMSWMIVKSNSNVNTISNINKQNEDNKNQIFKKYNLNWYDEWIGIKPPPKGVYEIANAMNEENNLRNKTTRNYTNSLFNQANKTIAVSKISPYYIYDYCCDVISNNNIPGIEDFYNKVIDYSNVYRNYIITNDKSDKDSYHLIWNHYGKISTFMTAKEVAIGDVPLFNYKRTNPKDVLTKIKFDLIVLTILSGILFIGVYVSFIKYDVR